MFRRAVTNACSRAPVAATGLARSQFIRPSLSSCTPSARLPAVAPVAVRGYHEKDNKPRNVGSMAKNDDDVGTGLVGAPACGDVMKLQIRVDKDSKKISDVKFKTFGCGSAIASSSYLTELVRGMTLEEAAKIRNTEIAKELCLPPVKLHCSMLAEDAIKSAISNYYTKNPRTATNLAGTGAAIPDMQVEVEETSSTAPKTA
ncbi:iron-binding protein [Ascosphaera pollenicola]|nr:iron-binding protein [Ascosphaera pollenicola]